MSVCCLARRDGRQNEVLRLATALVDIPRQNLNCLKMSSRHYFLLGGKICAASQPCTGLALHVDHVHSSMHIFFRVIMNNFPIKLGFWDRSVLRRTLSPLMFLVSELSVSYSMSEGDTKIFTVFLLLLVIPEAREWAQLYAREGKAWLGHIRS